MQVLEIHPLSSLWEHSLLFGTTVMISKKWHTNPKKEIADNIETAHLVEFTCAASRL